MIAIVERGYIAYLGGKKNGGAAVAEAWGGTKSQFVTFLKHVVRSIFFLPISLWNLPLAE